MSTWNKHYHWKTLNATKFTKEYFTTRLVGSSSELSSPSSGKVHVESLSNFDGDVELGNRKGKLITIYDCQITLDWQGKLESGTEAKGTIYFPEVSHEVEDEGSEYRFEAKMTTENNAETKVLLDAVRNQLAPSLLPHFHQYREQLIQANAKDVGHDSGVPSPAATSGTSTPQQGTQNGAPSTKSVKPSVESGKSSAKGGSSSTLSTTQVDVVADLSIRRDDLWDLLTNQGRIPMWTRAPAQFSLNPGSHFALFNNNIVGSITSVTAPSELVQKWRAPQWPSDHYGTLTTTLSEGESTTKLSLVLAGVPLEEEERSRDALDRFYIAGLKGLGLGTGSLV